MIVYLPHYDNAEEFSDHYYEVSDNCYTTLSAAIKEIEQKGFKITSYDKPDVWHMNDLDLNNKILPMTFETTNKNEYGMNEIAYIKEINLVEGDNDEKL